MYNFKQKTNDSRLLMFDTTQCCHIDGVFSLQKSFHCISTTCVSFCTGHFVIVPLNMTYLHCLQHSLFEHPFNFYYILFESDTLVLHLHNSF